MGQAKRDMDAVVEDRENTYWFTPASADEELDLQSYMHYTNIIVNTSSYAGAITLPSVAEAKGITYTIHVHTGTNTLTIQDRDQSTGWTDLTIEDPGDTVSVRSTGSTWVVVTNEEAD